MTEVAQCLSSPVPGSPGSIRVRMADGTCLNVREWGAGEHVCMLIHGFGDGGFVWNGLAGALQSEFRLLAVDLRGHGDSDWDATGEYRTDTYCNDILQLIDILRLERLTLIGHSLGASLAIRIAAISTGRVTSLVIVDYAPGILQEAREYVRSSLRDQLRRYDSPVDYATQLATVRPLVDPELLAQLAMHALRPGTEGGFELKCDPALGEGTAPAPDDTSLKSQLRAIACPVLVVRGAASALVSRQCVREMKKLLPRADWQDVPVAGHSVVLDNPAGFRAVVEPFLLRNRLAFARTMRS